MRVHGGHLIAWAATATLLFSVFCFGYGRAEEPFYPRDFDQVSYRSNAANLATALRSGDGIIAALRENVTAQGCVQVMLGAAAYVVGLDPVHASFAMFLVCMWLVWIGFTALGKSAWIGWAAVASLLSTRTLVQSNGGPTAFTTDFPAMSLWAAATALALGSRVFTQRRLALAAGIVLGICFLTRSVTVLYAAVGLPLFALAAWCEPSLPIWPERRRRLLNLGLAAGAAALLAAPYLVLELDRMWSYYVENHVSRRELEARGFGFDFLQHLGWYLSKLHAQHIGITGYGVGGVLLGYALLTRRMALGALRALLILEAAFLLPLLVLALGPQLNVPVIGIVTGPLLFLPVLLLAASPPRWPLPSTMRVIALVIGLVLWPIHFLWKCEQQHESRGQMGHRAAVVVNDAILRHTVGKNHVVVSTLPLIDAVSAPMLTMLAFVREGRAAQRFVGGLGHTIYACDGEPEFRRRLLESDVVVWWDRPPMFHLPSELEVTQRRATIEEVLATRFVLAPAPAGEQIFEARPLRLYFRKPEGER